MSANTDVVCVGKILSGISFVIFKDVFYLLQDD